MLDQQFISSLKEDDLLDNSRKTRKLIHYLNQGKVVCGSGAMPNVGDWTTSVTTCLRKVKSGYEVSIEVYFDGNDLREQNLRDETRFFVDLEEAVDYIEKETGVKFMQMHA